MPTIVSYQGKLTSLSGQPVADGTYIMDFSIHTAQSGGATFWIEPGRNVQVAGGIFTVLLGEDSPLSAAVLNGDRWLGVVVDRVELTPRTKLAAAPYAFRAHTAEHVLSTAAVTSLNNRTGAVALAAGDNITITSSGNTLTIFSSQDIPNPLPVIVQNEPTVRIDPNQNEVQAPTLWKKHTLWSTSQTVNAGQTLSSGVISTAGYKDMRVVLALQQAYSSPQDVQALIYARTGAGKPLTASLPAPASALPSGCSRVPSGWGAGAG